jgi:Cu2+-containing amine oxidase
LNELILEFEAKLTGIVLTRAAIPGEENPSATEIEPGLLAPYHQHLFCARLDLDVDGVGNTVYEVDAVAHPMGPENPAGNAYMTRELPLASESLAKRVIACLDVRANDNGDLVVTKGDQYDVRETGTTGEVRRRRCGWADEELPAAWVEQLALGGRLVAPLHSPAAHLCS